MFLRYILVVVSLYGSAQGSSVNKVNNFSIICLKLNKNKTHYDTLYIVHITVDSRYLEFDGTMEKIRVNHSSTQEELQRYRKCGLFNNERETTRAKF